MMLGIFCAGLKLTALREGRVLLFVMRRW